MSNISFVGGGAMAEAMVSGILGMRVATPEAILVSDPDPRRRNLLGETYKVRTTADNRAAVAAGDVVVLAVKPQTLGAVFDQIEGAFAPAQLLLSIVSGATISRLAAGLSHETVVRVMPNTPAQVCYGMSVWMATPAVDDIKRDLARAILRGLGEEIEVADEKYIDMATALSGSGPAYVALFIEALVDAGVHIGLPRPIAHRLVMQTVLGSTLLIEKTGKHPAEIRNMVTSPGGTTAEGLLQMEEGRLRATLTRAVIAAHEKARILGDTNHK